MNIAKGVFLTIAFVPLLAFAGDDAEEKTKSIWRPILDEKMFKALVTRELKTVEKAITTKKDQELLNGEIATVMIAGYALSAKGKMENANQIRNAALRLKELLGRSTKRDEARALVKAIASGKGTDSKPEDKSLRYYIGDDYDLMVLYMQPSRGGEGLHPNLVYTRRLAANEGYIENLFAKLATMRRALTGKQLEEMAEELQLVAYKTVISGRLIKEMAPTRKRGKRDPKIWHKTSDDMINSALALAMAAKQKNSDAIKKAADKLSRSCVECHKAFQ
ncbi:MAG: cytochrome c [Gemmataceae bacterium]